VRLGDVWEHATRVVTLVLTILAPIGAAIHLWRRPEPRTRERRVEVLLLWWFALALGVSSVLTGLVHVFDGQATADDIGFTRGEGGFQFENAMADVAVGVCSLLCLKIRGTWWLAVIVFASILYYGDAVGHVYQWLHNDNTEPGNVGIPLFLDVLVPAIATALYLLYQAERKSPAPGGAVAPSAGGVAGAP
jgi:hypothetical protein